MSTDIKLPIVAGDTRIHTLPGRPPFMLLTEIAEALDLKSSNVRRQFHRHLEKLPDGSWFPLTPDEYREKSSLRGTTSQGKRHDVEQYALTEIGVLILLRYLTGAGAEAGAAALITTIVQRHEAEREALRSALIEDEAKFIGRSTIKANIKLAALEGWSFARLAEKATCSMPVLVGHLQAMRLRGFIPQAALLPPVYLLRELEEKKARKAGHLIAHEQDARQLLLGLEG